MNVKSIRRENTRALAKSVGGIGRLALKLNKAQSQLSHLIGCSPIKNIGDKLAAHIESAFDKSSGWLDREHYRIEGTQTVYRTEQGQSAILCREIPLITWEEARQWHQLAYVYKPRGQDPFITTTEVSPLAFALRIQGDSMECPYGVSFPAGAFIVADPDQVATNGSFVVVSPHQNTEAILRQLVSDGNKKYIKPLNPRYPIIEYAVSTMIHGVVKQMVIHI